MNAMVFNTNKSVLADAALRYTLAGWPIVPVRLPPPCDAPTVPLRALVSHRPPSDADTARDWWTGGGYGIAVLVGVLFDVLVVPQRIGPTVAELLARCQPCAIAHPGGWWLFLATRGAPTLTDLPRRSGIELLGAGTQVLLPPTPTTTGCVEWGERRAGLADLVAPNAQGEPNLPNGMVAQQAAARAVAIRRRATSR
jgi:hypothetical protein